MRERLSYSLFREMGLPTCRTVYATVKRTSPDGSTSDHLGLYLAVEVLDG